MDRTEGFLDPAVEARSWDEQQAEMSAGLRDIVAHAYHNAPAVANQFRELGLEPGDIQGVEDLARIPVTPKMKLVEMQREDPPFGGLLAVPVAELPRIFRSPGPIYDPEPTNGWGWGEALYAAGIRPGDVSINTLGYHMTPAGMMFDEALRTIGSAVVPTGIGERETQVEIMQRAGVRGFVGMASFLLQIGEKAREMGIDPRADLSLEAAFVTAEPLPEALRASVEEMFGLILRQGYGTADCGCLAFECYHAGGMHLTTRAIVEIVDPTTGKPVAEGETGEVVVTLFNRSYPLIRFGTGDLSAVDGGSCACGRGAPKMRGWLGRADQLVKVKGMFVHPGQLQGVLREFPEVKRFQGVVTRSDNRDRMVLHAEVEGDASGLKGRLETRLREVLRIGIEVDPCPPGTVSEDGPVLQDNRTWE